MQQSISYIGALRVLATILVILIHASTGYLNNFHPASTDWHFANALNSFSRFSVPLFVMISGALLLNKQEDIVVFYQKRVSRILGPFAFWVFVYLVYYFYRYTNFDVLPLSRVAEISIDKLLHGPSAHLWFLYMIVGLYLAVPFLRILVTYSQERALLILLLVWSLSLVIMEKSYYAYVPKIDLTFFSGYAGYMILGYYLAKKAWHIPTLFLVFLIAAIGLLNTWGTFYISESNNGFSPTLYNYLGLNNAILAAAVFLLVKKLVTCPLPFAFAYLDRLSFGIYLVHIIVLNYVHPLIPFDTFLKIPLATLLTLLASSAIIFLLRKIPYVAYVSG
ncbi:acyltransferase [Sphingobacterium paludis]|uniref:Surface polysaccharide O-acyltransferase-like enzyme n=1 Tax=Sphingobacterium paludis TaxID=1476465 RepID=A0A4V3E138_9SPHI|nr:acyltransferase family protein [Sphingobacterium paludis]TDS10390.1 surface polysaccharide O-acyltransferase-like enzyme [Sphingobacterium paludis]